MFGNVNPTPSTSGTTSGFGTCSSPMSRQDLTIHQQVHLQITMQTRVPLQVDCLVHLNQPQALGLLEVERPRLLVMRAAEARSDRLPTLEATPQVEASLANLQRPTQRVPLEVVEACLDKTSLLRRSALPPVRPSSFLSHLLISCPDSTHHRVWNRCSRSTCDNRHFRHPIRCIF